MKDYKLVGKPRIRVDEKQIIVGQGADVVAFHKRTEPHLTVEEAVTTFMSCVSSIRHQPFEKWVRLHDLGHKIAAALYATQYPEWGENPDKSVHAIQREFKTTYIPFQPDDALRLILMAIWERKIIFPDGEKIPYPKVGELWDAVIDHKRLPPGKLETHRIPYANSYRPQVTERSRRFIAELHTSTGR